MIEYYVCVNVGLFLTSWEPLLWLWVNQDMDNWEVLNKIEFVLFISFGDLLDIDQCQETKKIETIGSDIQ